MLRKKCFPLELKVCLMTNPLACSPDLDSIYDVPLWSKNLSPFLEGLAIGELQLATFKITMIKERAPKMKNLAVSNSFSPSGAKDLMPPPGGNT